MDSTTILEPLSREELYSVHQFLSLESGSHPGIHRNSTKVELLEKLGEILSPDDASYCVEFFDNYDYYPVPWLKSELLDSLSDELLQVLVSSFLDDPDIPENHGALVERLTQSRYFLKEDARKFYLWHHYFQSRTTLEESEEKFAASRPSMASGASPSSTMAFESPFSSANPSGISASAAFEDSHTVQMDAFQLESYLVDANAYREKAFSTTADEASSSSPNQTSFRSSDSLFSSSSSSNLRPANNKATQAMFAFQDNVSPDVTAEIPSPVSESTSYATQQISFDSFMDFVTKKESPTPEDDAGATQVRKSPRRKDPAYQTSPFEKIASNVVVSESTLSTNDDISIGEFSNPARSSAVTMALDAASFLELLEDEDNESLEEVEVLKQKVADIVGGDTLSSKTREPSPVTQPPASDIATTGEYELDESYILDDSLELDEDSINILDDSVVELEEDHLVDEDSLVDAPELIEEIIEEPVEEPTPEPEPAPSAPAAEPAKQQQPQGAPRPVGASLTPNQVDRLAELLHRASILGGSYERPQIQAIRIFFQKVMDFWPVQLRRVRDVLKYLQSKEVPLVPMKLEGFEDISVQMPYAARLSLIHTTLFLLGCKSPQNLERHRDFIIDVTVTFHVHPGDVSMFSLFGIGPEEIQLSAFECLEVLGVTIEADEDEIRKAHRDKVRKYHPDKFHALGPDFRRLADRKMKELNMALEILLHRSGHSL